MPEFLIGLLISLATIVAAGGWLRSEWQRTRCAYLTFEAVHARLTEARWPSQGIDDERTGIRIDENERRVRGEGQCGTIHESVELPRLEPLSFSDEKGALSLPLVAILMAIALLGFGTWGVLRHWRLLAETQIRLDRCVGETALDLEHTLARIEAGNRRLRALRAAQALATVAGETGELIPLIALEATHQDAEILRWQSRQITWLARRGCESRGDWPSPLPSMQWLRPPPDPLGPQPLLWQMGASAAMRVQLRHAPRGAAALVTTHTRGVMNETKWKAAWTQPLGETAGHFGTSFD